MEQIGFETLAPGIPKQGGELVHSSAQWYFLIAKLFQSSLNVWHRVWKGRLTWKKDSLSLLGPSIHRRESRIECHTSNQLNADHFWTTFFSKNTQNWIYQHSCKVMVGWFIFKKTFFREIHTECWVVNFKISKFHIIIAAASQTSEFHIQVSRVTMTRCGYF